MFYMQLDVRAAFLNGKIEEVIYMKQPEGYLDQDNPDLVCKLTGNLYGLKQASRVWYQTIHPFLVTLGLKPIPADPCVYMMKNNDELTILGLYVDNIILASDSDSTAATIKSALFERFSMTIEEDNLILIRGLLLTVRRASKIDFVCWLN